MKIQFTTRHWLAAIALVGAMLLGDCVGITTRIREASSWVASKLSRERSPKAARTPDGVKIEVRENEPLLKLLVPFEKIHVVIPRSRSAAMRFADFDHSVPDPDTVTDFDNPRPAEHYAEIALLGFGRLTEWMSDGKKPNHRTGYFTYEERNDGFYDLIPVDMAFIRAEIAKQGFRFATYDEAFSYFTLHEKEYKSIEMEAWGSNISRNCCSDSFTPSFVKSDGKKYLSWRDPTQKSRSCNELNFRKVKVLVVKK